MEGQLEETRPEKRQRIQPIPTNVVLWYPQEDFQCAVHAMFPGLLRGFKVPCVEDIINQGIFIPYLQWNEGEGTLSDTHPPSWCNVAERSQIQSALGKQLGAAGSKRALPPLATSASGPEEHLRSALKLADDFVFPGSEPIQAEPDLRYAADVTVRHVHHLREFRQKCRGALRELARWLTPMTNHLRKYQTHGVRSVAGTVHVALIAVFVYLMRWPDRWLPWRFIFGFLVIGPGEETGIFRPREVSVQTESRASLLSTHKYQLAECKLQRADQDATFLWNACLDDASKGFGEQPVTEEELDSRFGPCGWCSNPRFCVTHASCKRRPIDDGKRSLVNAATSFSETLVLCTAFQLCISAQLLVEQASSRGIVLSGQSLESGGEDLPDAYRHVPASPDDYCCNIVAVPEPISGLWKFQIMWGAAVWPCECSYEL